jgi:hypothetical protein
MASQSPDAAGAARQYLRRRRRGVVSESITLLFAESFTQSVSFAESVTQSISFAESFA